MKTAFFAAVAALLLWTADALSIPQSRESPRVVALGTERRAPRNPVHRRLRKRGSIAVGLDNEETLYFINATIGTPAKSVRLHLDTGSSDLWVNTPGSQLCASQSEPCAYAGTYSANASSTYQYIGSYFNISYVDGSGAAGDYVSDTVTIGGQTIDRLQFGVGYSSSNAQGILGIGYPANEVQVSRAGLRPYDNLPAQLVADGAIRSKAYSIWLNDLDASTGSILFGGVDSEKYAAPLQSIPVEPQAGGVYSEFLITLTGLRLGGRTIRSGLALAVLLDTGSSLTYLPDAIAQEIFNLVGAVFDSDANAAYVPCSLARNTSVTLDFTFTAPTVAVEMNELVIDLITADGRRPTFSDGVAACLFGIAPAGAGTNVLGDTFLRSAYVVYDLDNNYVSLAATRFNATASDVREIGTGEDAVPGATKVQNPVRATEGIRGGLASDTSSAHRPAVWSPGRGTASLAAAVAAVVGALVGV